MLKVTAVFCVFFLCACSGKNEKDEQDPRIKDSISKIEQRRAADSMKQKNPLLILPPDSTYTGSYVDKYPNGITKFTGFFRIGKRHGQWVSFYPNGLPWSELHFDKGLRHGPNVTYFENGNKRFEGIYKNDQRDSIWQYYDSTGKPATRILFKNNRIIKELPLQP